MIEINLIPRELRREAGKARFFWLNPKTLKMAGVAFLGLTFLCYIFYLFDIKTLKKLKAQWPAIQQEALRVDSIRTEVEGGSKKQKEFLEGYVTSTLPTTKILSAVSELLPDSIWLVELNVTREPKENTFLLKGLSLLSKRHTSIQDIEKYIRDLKKVFPPSSELVLTTSRQQKEDMELTLFTAVFKWT